MLRSQYALLLFATAALVACSDDYGQPCDLPNSGTISVFCGHESDQGETTSSATCLFTNSTQCETRMCARYIGSSDFCTKSCDPDDESSCPVDSFCQTVPATTLAFCVPESIAESVR